MPIYYICFPHQKLLRQIFLAAKWSRCTAIDFIAADADFGPLAYRTAHSPSTSATSVPSASSPPTMPIFLLTLQRLRHDAIADLMT